MTRSCNIRGVPLMTHMISLIGSLKIALLLMDPKLIMSPRGKENKSVRINSLRVPKKPSKSDTVTVININFPLGYCVISAS